MNGQHTPGPWEWDEEHHGIYQARVKDTTTLEDGTEVRRGLVALPYERWVVGDMSDGANTRLIVAAPELLKALKGIASLYEYHSKGSVASMWSGPPPAEHMHAIRAAIRKAEGSDGR